MRHLLAALWVCLAAILAAPGVQAEEQEVQVLALASPDAFENARALSGALRRAVIRTKGWSLASGEFSLEVLAAALDCSEPPDLPCLAKIGKQVEADRILWGVVQKAGDGQVEASLHLWIGGEEKKATTLTFSESLNDDTDDALLELAEGALGKLLGKPVGTLIIAAGRVNGEVMINGMLVGLIEDGQATLEVPSGKLTVLVEAPGYENLLGTVDVPAGGSATLRLDPIPATDAPPPSEPQVDLGIEEDGSSQRHLYGYAAVGLGGVSAIVGSLFWLQSYNQSHDSEFETYVAQTPSNQDPCVRARSDPGAGDIVDICDANVSSRTAALVMIPLGAVLGGVGAYLLLTDSTPSEEPHAGFETGGVRIEPRVQLGRTSGRLDLSLHF